MVMDSMTAKPVPMTEIFALVKVDYGFRDGWHVFTSNDVPDAGGPAEAGPV